MRNTSYIQMLDNILAQHRRFMNEEELLVHICKVLNLKIKWNKKSLRIFR